MKRTLPILFLISFAATCLGQLPPYVRSPFTTNSPSTITNIVRSLSSGGATNGIQQLNGTGTNTTLVDPTVSGTLTADTVSGTNAIFDHIYGNFSTATNGAGNTPLFSASPGNASGLTNLPATSLTGTIPLPRLPGLVVTNESATENAYAIGASSGADASGALAYGAEAQATGVDSVAIGSQTYATAWDAAALGAGAVAGHQGSVALGALAQTTAANQIRIGTASDTVSVPGALSVSGGGTNTLGATVFTNGVYGNGSGLTNLPHQWLLSVYTNNDTGSDMDGVVGHSIIHGNGGSYITTNAPFPIDPLSTETDGTWAGKWNYFGGWDAGISNSSGNLNTYLGSGAGQWTTIGDQNTYVGAFAGQHNIDGYHNSFFGVGAGQWNQHAIFSVLVGTDCNLHGDGGNGNTIVGTSAAGLLAGDYNTIFGSQASLYTVTSRGSVIGGVYASAFTTNSYYDVALGYGSLQYSLASGLNVSIGAASAASVRRGSNNVFIGAYSDSEVASSTNLHGSIAIGYGAKVSGNDQTVIGSTTTTDAIIHGATQFPDGVSAASVTSTGALSGGATTIGSLSATGFVHRLKAGSDNTFVVYNGRAQVGGDSLVAGTLSVTAPAYVSPMPLAQNSTNGFVSWLLSGGAGLWAGIDNTGSAWFQSRNSAGGLSAYNMSFQPLGGNVGIGTTAPTNKLQILGDIHAETTVYANNGLFTNNVTIGGTATASTLNTTTPAFKSLGTNNVILRCPDGGSFILRIDNAGTISTTTNNSNL